ncbi:MAG: response regulator [Pseudomonadota bacterium]
MKVLPIARILIIDADAERRQTTKLGLTALGVGTVTEAATTAEALDLPRQFDVVVVQAASVDDVPAHPFKDTGDAIPAVVVAEGSAHALARAAGRHGYDAAVGMPLLPRLLYRRIGSVLQRARRSQRPGGVAAEGAEASATAPTAN